MKSLLDNLKEKERRGSKPRCHLLTHGSRDAVAARLTALVTPFASVSPSDSWMPEGFDNVKEATLPEANRLLPLDVRAALKRWWLAVETRNRRTPCWDIASTCTIGARPGILLVEAKAHHNELTKESAGKVLRTDASEDSLRNHSSIHAAIQGANIALTGCTGLHWALSRDWNYQMSNRFSWAWKLAELGVPVVLVYLGFLNANEMSDQGAPIVDSAEWRLLVTRHGKQLFPESVWDQRWSCSGNELVPLIRAVEISLQDAQLS